MKVGSMWLSYWQGQRDERGWISTNLKRTERTGSQENILRTDLVTIYWEPVLCNMSHFRVYNELPQVCFCLSGFPTVIKKGRNSSKGTYRFSFGANKKEEASQIKSNAQSHGTRLGQKKKSEMMIGRVNVLREWRKGSGLQEEKGSIDS